MICFQHVWRWLETRFGGSQAAQVEGGRKCKRDCSVHIYACGSVQLTKTPWKGQWKVVVRVLSWPTSSCVGLWVSKRNRQMLSVIFLRRGPTFPASSSAPPSFSRATRSLLSASSINLWADVFVGPRRPSSLWPFQICRTVCSIAIILFASSVKNQKQWRSCISGTWTRCRSINCLSQLEVLQQPDWFGCTERKVEQMLVSCFKWCNVKLRVPSYFYF